MEPKTNGSSQGTTMVCVVCGPSLFNTRLPQPAREAQLLHEALTSQLTSACPFCQETTVAHSLIVGYGDLFRMRYSEIKRPVTL